VPKSSIAKRTPSAADPAQRLDVLGEAGHQHALGDLKLQAGSLERVGSQAGLDLLA